MSHFSVPITWHCVPPNLAINTACALKIVKASLSSGPSNCTERKEASCAARGPEMSALRKITGDLSEVKGVFLLIGNGRTSRVSRMHEICPDNSLKMSESQHTRNVCSGTVISVVFIVN